MNLSDLKDRIIVNINKGKTLDISCRGFHGGGEALPLLLSTPLIILNLFYY